MGERDCRPGNSNSITGTCRWTGLDGVCSTDELRCDCDTAATTCAADGVCRAGESRVVDGMDSASVFKHVCG
jgi:hypothetical protein